MCSLSFDSWMLLFTAIGTIGLAIIAGLAFNKFLSQEALKTQMSIVIKLVETLSASRVKTALIFPESTGTPTIKRHLNIFEMTVDGLQLTGNNFECILLKNFINMSMEEAFKFLGNPLVPRKIAERLFALNRLGVVQTSKAFDKPYYQIGHDGDTPNFVKETYVQVPGNVNGFITCCINLKNAITDWFSENGVTDINNVAFMNLGDGKFYT